MTKVIKKCKQTKNKLFGSSKKGVFDGVTFFLKHSLYESCQLHIKRGRDRNIETLHYVTFQGILRTKKTQQVRNVSKKIVIFWKASVAEAIIQKVFSASALRAIHDKTLYIWNWWILCFVKFQMLYLFDYPQFTDTGQKCYLSHILIREYFAEPTLKIRETLSDNNTNLLALY